MWNKLLIIVALATLAGCGGNTQKKKTAGTDTVAEATDMHNAANSLDYQGTYTGTIPAADAPGIEVRLVLKNNGTYDMHMKFIDRDAEFDEQGGYSVKENILTLTPADGEGIGYYKVEENRLRMLDPDKQVITGPLEKNYILEKN